MLRAMRNPIQPSPDRPVPLPDCILMDGWWADRDDKLRERSESMPRLVAEGGKFARGPQHDETRPLG
jgi:hypothetical protein